MKKIMSREEMLEFVPQLSRAELGTDPIIYLKAVRVSLIALGYDEDWVGGEFRTFLEKFYEWDLKNRRKPI